MHLSSLKHLITEKERESFERDGYLVIPKALTTELVESLIHRLDLLDREYRPRLGIEHNERLHLRDFLNSDPLFLDLLDWPAVFPKIWGILGWHIQLYLAHVDVTPQESKELIGQPLAWHQDSGRVNLEMEGNPRPRLSVKVGYFLTDTREIGCGNFYVIPGSHTSNTLEEAKRRTKNSDAALPICVEPGTAVIFDRRLWHSRSINESTRTRKAIFYGYSYRWLRPRDNTHIGDFSDCVDPIRRQLLGASHDGHGYSSPSEEDVPLKHWIAKHLGAEAVTP